jgi:hypothetical protein
LKIIGLALLAASMIGTGVIQKDMPTDLAEADFARLTAALALEIVSWAAIPIYAWLLCDGFRHSRSVARHASRLLVLAVISEVPYDLATSGAPWDMSSQNPVFALLVSWLVLVFGRGFKGVTRASRGLAWAALSAAGAIWLLFFNVGLRLGLMPAGVLLLAFTLVFWFLDERQNTMMFTGALIGVLGGVSPAFGFVVLHFRDGQLGTRLDSKRYFFYGLYPLCLLAAGLYRALAP